jgi:hypothetical protein
VWLQNTLFHTSWQALNDALKNEIKSWIMTSMPTKIVKHILQSFLRLRRQKSKKMLMLSIYLVKIHYQSVDERINQQVLEVNEKIKHLELER